MTQRKSINKQDVDADQQPTMENAERLFFLVRFLQMNKCTREEVFRQLTQYYRTDDSTLSSSSSKRSADKIFERDLAFLERLGFTIQKVKYPRLPARYHLVPGTGPHTALLLTTLEVDGLSLIYNMFADPSRHVPQDPSYPLPQPQSPHPFSKDVLSLIERLSSALSPEQQQQFENRTKKPYLYFNVSTVADYLSHRPTIEAIIDAIMQKRPISFLYTATNSQGAIQHEHIKPYYITYMDGHFYMIAYHYDKGKHLEYRIDRIQPGTVDPYPKTTDVEHRRHLIVFSYWLDAGIAQPDLSQRWLKQEIVDTRTTTDHHGREHHWVLVRATAYNEFRILQQLLKYGEKAELVDPPSLRARMREIVEQMRSYYREE